MSKKIETFLEVVESLSRYRRAELIDESTEENLIESLYVDPLNNDLLLQSMLSKNSTLLIGRKGTGKSTIINRFQHEIRKSDDKISLYIDVNALFEQSRNSNFTNTLNIDAKLDIQKLSLYLEFTKNIIQEIKNEIKKNLFVSKFKKIFTRDGLTEREFQLELESLFNNIENPTYIDVSMSQTVNIKTEDNQKDISQANASASISVSDASAKASSSISNDTEKKDFQAYSKVLQRYFNIIEFMKELKELLEKVQIKMVYICLDDASELEKEHLEVFTNTIIAPLNNLSNEFYKFKISLYPGRVFLPNIDRMKVDTFNLDYYDLYSAGNADKVEESAINYTKRLIETRFRYFFGQDININDFFDVEDLYKLLFQISSNVPRSMGKILKIALHKSNSLERKITKKVLQESAKQYYKDYIEYVLVKNEYIQYKSYDESFEQYHLYELLKAVIAKAIENKKHIGESTSQIFSDYNPNNAPSNYIHIPKEMEDLLKTLEFNFFITKYSEQKNKDSKDISVFTLNYGLCIDNNIIFDDGSDRKFRVQRIFDFKNIIYDWLKNSNQLVCEDCNKVYSLDEQQMIDKYGCIECKKNNVRIKPIVNDEFQEKLNRTFKLPKKEFDVLNTLHTSDEGLTASLIGAELDRSYQSVSHSMNRNSEIKNSDFIERVNENSKPHFYITVKGQSFISDGKLL